MKSPIQTSRPFPSGSAIRRAVTGLLVLATLAVFWQVHRFEFLLWDDGLHIFENPYLQTITFDNILNFWRKPYATLYIPLTYTLWALTTAVSRGMAATGGAPLDPQYFHILNLFVHLLSVLVVWRVLRLLLIRSIQRAQPTVAGTSSTNAEWAACAGAILFAVHPMQVEAVAWATGLKDLLCGLLSYVAVWQYLVYACGAVETTASRKLTRGKARWSMRAYWLATGAFVLALLAKPMAVVVPLLVWLLDMWGWPRTWRGRLPALLGWLGLAVLWGFFTSQFQPPSPGTFITPIWARLLIAGDALTFYLYKLGVPIWLGPDYGRTPEAMLTQDWLWLTGLAPWGLLVWLWCKRTRVPWLAAATGVLIAGLLPVLGLVPFSFQAYSTVADRYMYIAMLGPSLAFAWIFAHSRRRWLAIGCTVILAALAIRSVLQTRYWHDTVSLFEHALIVYPQSPMAYNTLGRVMAAENRLSKATWYYTQALRSGPRHAQAHHNLGNALSRQGKTQEAIQRYQEALRIQPDFAEAHNGLGAALASQSRVAEAVRHYTIAIRLKPAYARAHYNLGNVLAGQGEMQQAIQRYTAALRIQPNFAEAHSNLGAALASQSHFDKAIRHYTTAIRLKPRYIKAHYNMGVALFNQGRLSQARKHFAEILRLDPSHARARHFFERVLGESNTMGASRPKLRQ